MKKLLFFVDEGGFDDFSPFFIDLGFEVDFATNPRKVVKLAKQNQYDVLVAEFNYNPEFRDRVSNIESLLAALQQKSPNIKIIILYDQINQPQLNQLTKRYAIDHQLVIPTSKEQLRTLL